MLETCREMKCINKYMKKYIRFVINKNRCTGFVRSCSFLCTRGSWKFRVAAAAVLYCGLFWNYFIALLMGQDQES